MASPSGIGDSVEVDYYPRDGSVFLDTHYLIKGVGGALFWKLACEYERSRRREFSLRELRLWGDELRLPEIQDNLSARMLLLQRRLAERGAAVQIAKIGRGRIRVDVQQPLRLNEAMSSRPALAIAAVANAPGLPGAGVAPTRGDAQERSRPTWWPARRDSNPRPPA